MHVIYSKKSRKSGAALDQALQDAGYDGPLINFGFSGSRILDTINIPNAVAMATNKRIALQIMTDAFVPTLLWDESPDSLLWDYGEIPIPFPVVARPDFHRAGKWLHICHTHDELARAYRLVKNRRTGEPSAARATHTQRYLQDAREFRVHVMAGKSIKISEKIGGGNHSTGAIFEYPHDFENKATLREVAKHAVSALGLDFGAVDLLYRDGQFHVLEVNTAPRLTDPNSDTLARYVRAFIKYYNETVGR